VDVRCSGHRANWGSSGSYRIDLFAALLCLLIAYVLNRGMRSAARFETALVYVKVAIVLLVIVVGVFHINSANYSPFAHSDWPARSPARQPSSSPCSATTR